MHEKYNIIFFSSHLPHCVQFSPWKKFVLSGGLDHNKGKNKIIINHCQIQGVFKDVYEILQHLKVLERIFKIQGVSMGFLEVWA